MTDPTLAGGFSPTESFESGRVTAVSADESRVVVGTATGDVEIVTADGRTTVEFDAAITDLAAGNRVYALVDGTVSALSAAGTRVWSIELPEAKEIAALPGPDVLGVVTDDGLLGFDGETGREEFDVERPYADVTDDPGFFGTDGAFVLVAWSFLAVRNLDGTERFELNLDGAIESAGIVDDTVVVSLKDERVVGVHAKTGDHQWERELSVTDLPDRGEDALLFSADDQLVTLSADGTYATVEELPGGDVYPSSDGSLFCAISDGTIGVYCASGDPAESLEVSAGDDELVPGVTDEIALEVRNAGDRPISATLRVEGDGLSLRRSDCAVDLAPGESAIQEFGVESVAQEVDAESVTQEFDDDSATADESATLAVEADGEPVDSVSLSVVAPSAGSLDATAELDRVADGVAEFAVEVRNEGDAALTDVSVSPGDVHLGRLAPDESATATVEAGFEPGGVVPILVGDGESEAELEATLDRDPCEVGIEATPDGFVDVRVENRSDARLADELTVRGNCFDARVERRVEIPGESAFVLALRPDAVPDEAQVEATLVGVGTSESARLGSHRFDAVGRGRDAGGGRDAGRSGTTGGSGQRGSNDTQSIGATSSRATDAVEATASTGPSASGASTAGGGAGAGRGSGAGEASGGAEDTADAAGKPARTVLAAERTVGASDLARTQGIREEIEVTNEGDEQSAGVRVEFPEETVAVGDLAPGERALFERYHAFGETGRVTLPAGTVTAKDAAEVRIAEQDLDVTSGDLEAEVTIEPADGAYRVRATLANRRDVTCEVTRIGAKQFGVWDPDDLRIPPGETVEWTRRVEPASATAEAVETAVEYAFDGGETHRLATLGRVRDATGQTASEGVDALAVSIGEETRISGGYGSVVLVVENQSDAPLSDVSVEASGEAVSNLMYTGRESVGDLAPGDRFTHFVDVETEGPEASISVVLSAAENVEGAKGNETDAAGDAGDEAELTLSGPAPADEDDWSAESLDDWTVDRADDSGSDGMAHVATEFKQA